MEINTLIFNKRKKKVIEEEELVDPVEIKFYRRRIQDLTRQFLYGEAPPIFYKDVETSFQLYAKTCVLYLKSLDTNDLNQEEYLFLSKTEEKENNIIQPSPSMSELSTHIFKFKQPSHQNSLEKLVKKMPSTLVETPQFIPKQKEFNLLDPALRNKGICKKKSIITLHENSETAEKMEQQEKEKYQEKDERGEEEKNCIIDEKFFITAMQSESNTEK